MAWVLMGFNPLVLCQETRAARWPAREGEDQEEVRGQLVSGVRGGLLQPLPKEDIKNCPSVSRDSYFRKKKHLINLCSSHVAYLTLCRDNQDVS